MFCGPASHQPDHEREVPSSALTDQRQALLGIRGQQASVHGEAVVRGCREGILRGQPIVDRVHGQGGLRGKRRGVGQGRARVAEREATAVQVDDGSRTGRRRR